MRPLTRRAVALAGWGGVVGALAGCTSVSDMPVLGVLFEDWPREAVGPVESPDYTRIYGRLESEPVPIPPFDFTNMDPMFLRSNVPYAGREAPGTVVVDPRRRMLYLVEPRARATRYGIGIGPGGSGFAGPAEIRGRETWPDRNATVASHAPGEPAWAQLASAGRERAPVRRPRYPLGARLLPILVEGRDVGLWIHGTSEPDAVGTDVTSGSLRMINQDVIDLYEGVADGAPVVVLA